MKILDCEQGGDQWFQHRAGKITASAADSLLTPKFKTRDGKGVETLLCKIIAEKWYGRPLDEEKFSSLPMEYGNLLEIEAKPMFRLITNLEIRTVGFIETDDGICGCSPDAIGEDFGVEIKSPMPTNHVRYLLSGEMVEEYLAQVHFSLYVTGFSHWYFMSYRRLMPPLILRVERDEKIISLIAEAVAGFKAKLDAGWSKIIEQNGGKEPVRPPTVDEVLAQDRANESKYEAGIDHLAGC
jgi:hypothetical protein